MRKEEEVPRGRPVIFGEVLFDCFEDEGVEVLGGAPFNVAWHLRGLGLNPLFISRVGRDRRGRQVREALEGWGITTAGLQDDTEHPTGEVRIRLDAGQPRFAILPDRAYDFIDPLEALAALPETPALLYHGSLAARSGVSAATLTRLRAQLPDTPRFVDVNLRAPWWNAADLRRSLHGSRWVKLNDEEVAELTGTDARGDAALTAAAEAFRLENRIETLILTLGAEGAALTDGRGHWRAYPPATAVVDTVGAGDAFSAVAIYGLLAGWEPPLILERAVAFAAAICRVRGATVADPTLYRAQLQSWGS